MSGWFSDTSASPAVTGLFVPVAPARVLDTREGAGAPVGALGPDGFLDLALGGQGGLPAGQTVPNAAILPVGAGAAVSFSTRSGTHLIADVSGWFVGWGPGRVGRTGCRGGGGATAGSGASGSPGSLCHVAVVRARTMQTGGGLPPSVR